MMDVVRVLVATLALAIGLGNAPACTETLDFSKALDIVTNHHEGLKALGEEQAAAQAAVRQASAFPNPEIEVGAQDFGRAEVEAVVSQSVPLGGRRRAARTLAEHRAALAGLHLESGQISLSAELTRRFTHVLAAQRRLALVDSLLEVATINITAVERLAGAGATMQIDAVRANLEKDELMLERARLARALAETQVRLAGLWGDHTLEFTMVTGSIGAHPSVPTLEDLQAALELHPDWRALDTEMAIIQAEAHEARAEGMPELSLSIGYLRDNEAGEGAMLAGASLSLPIFDRKRAEVTEKQHQMAALGYQAGLERRGRATDLTTLLSELRGVAAELATISTDVMTKASLIHDTLEDLYAQGKLGILDVLEARGHLLELRMRIVDLREQQALLAVDIQELTGYEFDVIE
jgi:cobalt-zinc-cadmium efflux system outer membrane protein